MATASRGALVALLVALLTVALGATAASAAPKSRKAQVGDLRLQVEAAQRTQSQARRAVRRSCKVVSIRCRRDRAALALAGARLKQLRRDLERLERASPAPATGSAPALSSAPTAVSAPAEITEPAAGPTPASASPSVSAPVADATSTPTAPAPAPAAPAPAPAPAVPVPAAPVPAAPVPAAPVPAAPVPAAPVPAAPAPAPAPAPPAPAARATQIGINSGSWLEYDVPGTVRLGAKHVRLSFDVATPAAELAEVIGAYADRGVQVLLLGYFTGRIPTVEESRNVGAWAKAYGPDGTFWANRTDGSLAVRLIEFGNETSAGYQYGDGAEHASYRARARAYALRFKDAHDAIAAAGADVDLLAVVQDWTGTWVDGLYAAVPGFHRYVGGWIVHHYGPDPRGSIRIALEHVTRHGAPSSIPVDVTETGVASDDGSCLSDNYGLDNCMSYARAAGSLRETVDGLERELGSRLRTISIYQVRDQRLPGASVDREHFFGALTKDLADKGAYTAEVRELMAEGA